jgi:hypothetical protein
MPNKTFMKAFTLLFLATIATLWTCFAIEKVLGFEEWVPFIPSAEVVELCYWEQRGLSYVNVSITFPNTGFNVSDWGNPVFDGNSI